MPTRELYKEKYAAQMHEWSARVDLLKAQSEKLTAKAKLDVSPYLETVSGKLEAAKKKLADLAAATDDTWHDLVKEADAVWDDLTSAAGGAHDALTRHQKS